MRQMVFSNACDETIQCCNSKFLESSELLLTFLVIPTFVVLVLGDFVHIPYFLKIFVFWKFFSLVFFIATLVAKKKYSNAIFDSTGVAILCMMVEVFLIVSLRKVFKTL